MSRKSEALDALITANSVLINAMTALQQASMQVKQAHDDGWSDDDERWDAVWVAADAAQLAARQRLD